MIPLHMKHWISFGQRTRALTLKSWSGTPQILPFAALLRRYEDEARHVAWRGSDVPETVPAIGVVRPESAGEAWLLTLSVPAPFMVPKEPRTFWSPVSVERRFLGPSLLSPGGENLSSLFTFKHFCNYFFRL